MEYSRLVNRVKNGDQQEETVTCIDVSGSMESDDWPPSRKDAGIAANRELCIAKAQAYPDDLFGVIAFGTESRLLSEPRRLGDNCERLLCALNNIPTLGGTNITGALELAHHCLFGNAATPAGLATLSKRVSTSIARFLYGDPASTSQPTENHNNDRVRRVILLSDGEHLIGPPPFSVAQALKNKGVIIDCIGIGGTPSNVDEATLKAIASRNSNGSIRYSFIGDKRQLIKKYKTMAHHIRRV